MYVFLNSDVVAKVPFALAQAIRVERSALDRSCLLVDPSHMEVRSKSRVNTVVTSDTEQYARRYRTGTVS